VPAIGSSESCRCNLTEFTMDVPDSDSPQTVPRGMVSFKTKLLDEAFPKLVYLKPEVGW
jgi:hypothetical protein